MTEFNLECQSIRPNIGMDERKCHECGDMLSKLIADEFVLFIKAINWRFNVMGKHKEMLKDLFKVQAETFRCNMELASKEMRNLGYRVPHVTEKLYLTRISPSPKDKWPDEITMIRILLEDSERVLLYLRRDAKRLDEELEVPDLAEFYAWILRVHKEMAKKLRAHLEEKGGRSSKSSSWKSY
ncbi:hypothetical protein QOT17_015763 [Balamuthia mandrillaris]